MTATHLLDANALIALVASDHEHHDRVISWMNRTDLVALCPIVEGALVRFLVRIGEGSATAIALLAAVYSSGRCEFWEDAISYAAADLRQVIGHRQVTDAYLVALATSRGARLATLDLALARTSPAIAELIG